MANRQQDAIKQLNEQIKSIKVAMLTTVEAGGILHARPMAAQQTPFDGDLWFFTGKDTATVHDVERDDRVNVTYAATDDGRWVSVFGLAEVTRDKQKAQDLWDPIYKPWFPNGLDDPDLVLLKVNVAQAEYWDTASGTMTQIAGFVKSLVGDHQFQPGANAQLEFPEA